MTDKITPPDPAPRRGVRAFWYTIFFLAGLVAMYWPLYNRVEPMLLGLPFFYWFQFLWVTSGAVIAGLAYRARA